MSSEMLIMALVTALLTSCFTLLGAYLVYRFFLAARLNEAMEKAGEEHTEQLRLGLTESAQELMPEFRQEVVSGFEQAAKELIPEFREEMVAGFEGAAQELMPDFRKEVEQGFTAGAKGVLPEFREEVAGGVRDALVGVASVDFVDKTAQNVAKKSTKFFEAGLNAIFGKSKNKKDHKE